MSVPSTAFGADVICARVPNALVASGICASIGAFRLGPVDLEVRAGEVVALVGANGAGKTTLLNVLSGGMRAEAGTVDLGTTELAPPAVACGYVMDESVLPGDLAAAELFDLAASLVAGHDKTRKRQILAAADDLAALLNFSESRKLIGTLSHGNHQKVKLIASAMVTPRNLLLDEPRNGLDPKAIQALDALIKRQTARGTPVLVATHDLWYARRAADRVIVLAAGRVMANVNSGEVSERDLRDWIVTAEDQ